MFGQREKMKARGCELDHVPVMEVLIVKMSQSESGHGQGMWGGCSRHTNACTHTNLLLSEDPVSLQSFGHC